MNGFPIATPAAAIGDFAGRAVGRACQDVPTADPRMASRPKPPTIMATAQPAMASRREMA